MSRELLNNKYCVRCGKKDPTPYLKKYVHLFKDADDWENQSVVDIGCGNGRNSEFMKQEGFKNVVSLDMKPDYGLAMTLGEDKMPVPDKSVNVILANYILMFLNYREFNQVMDEVERIAAPGAIFMYELYAAKDSHCKNKQQLISCRDGIVSRLGWKKIRHAQERGILQEE
jgi:SAM-dependent methyltransferase